MLEPTKHMNIDLSVLNIASNILNELNRSRIASYNILENKLIEKLGADVKFNFPNALSFLYLLGKIEYHLKTDTFELIQITN